LFDLVGACQTEANQCRDVIFVVVAKTGNFAHGKVNRGKHVNPKLIDIQVNQNGIVQCKVGVSEANPNVRPISHS
jgi:hypothetical protein